MNIKWYREFVSPKDCADILDMEDRGVLNKNQRREVLRVLFEERAKR